MKKLFYVLAMTVAFAGCAVEQNILLPPGLQWTTLLTQTTQPS